LRARDYPNASIVNDDTRLFEGRERLSLSHRMGEGRGEGPVGSKSLARRDYPNASIANNDTRLFKERERLSLSHPMPERFRCEAAGARHLFRFAVANAIRMEFFEVTVWLGIEAA
jgi:hypothetical protein